MEPWRLLGIPQGSDVATIKRAYALKIKQHRPDVDPVEFQRIHQAYKTLLATVRREQASSNCEPTPAAQAFSSGLIFSQQGVQESAVAPAEAEPSVAPLQEPPLDTLEEPAAESSAAPPRQEADTESAAAQQETARRRHAARQAQAQLEQERTLQQQARQQAFDATLQQVTENFQHQHTLSRLEPWQFLTTSPWLLDGEFNQRLSIKVFKLLVAHYHELSSHKRGPSRGRKRYGPVQPSYAVLALFDQLFNWQGQQRWLEHSAAEHLTQLIFNRLHDGPDLDPVKGLRGHATVVKVEQAAEPVKAPFNWENLVGWLVALSLVVQMVKAAFFR